MRLSIVIVNWNGRDMLDACLRSIAETAPELQPAIYVVDNGSRDGSQAMLRERHASVHLFEAPHNPGFAGGNNIALRAILQAEHERSTLASGPHYILLLNPDTIVQPGALQALVSYLDRHPSIGLVGALLLNPDGSFQASSVPFPTLYQEWMILSGLGRKRYGEWYPSRGPQQSLQAHRADYVVGACMLLRLEVLQQVGLLDELFFMYSEEVDWCYRIRTAGWDIACEPAARITHIGGGSTRQVRPQMLAQLYRSRVLFFRKHYGRLPALGLKALLLLMTGAKLLRRSLRPDPHGTPPLSWDLLQTALRDQA